jgi:hypothetical protein
VDIGGIWEIEYAHGCSTVNSVVDRGIEYYGRFGICLGSDVQWRANGRGDGSADPGQDDKAIENERINGRYPQTE